MHRRELVRRIAGEANRAGAVWSLVRRGGNHDVYKLDHLTIAIPRHNEITDRTTESIFRECEPVLGTRWWRTDKGGHNA